MQEFLLELWKRIRATVVFITHDIEEAITLGDRLVVMTARPGRVALDRKICLPRPRHLDLETAAEFLELKRAARAIFAR